MYSSTGNGPSRRMRSRSFSSSGLRSSCSGAALLVAGRRCAGCPICRCRRRSSAASRDAGGERPHGQPVSGVGLAEQLAEGARQPVARQERAADERPASARPAWGASATTARRTGGPLRGRPRRAGSDGAADGPAAAETPSPRHGAGRPHSSRVDEVGEPAEEQAHRRCRRAQSSTLQASPRHAARTTPWPRSCRATPHGRPCRRSRPRDIRRDAQEVARFVEQHVAEPAAEQHAERHVSSRSSSSRGSNGALPSGHSRSCWSRRLI